MSARLGRISAHLAEPVTELSADLVAKINQNVNPPTEVSADDVYVRVMYVVSDQVNSFGGCFPADEHEQLVDLLIDSPVLVGHRKDKLPLGRTFHAEIAERDSSRWVKAWFYWLRSSTGAESLRENIDGGIYKECSIGFTFSLAECSICGKDIRLCEHEPFETYAADGERRTCHFNYRKIERVLETSLVYRGATAGTGITRHALDSDAGRLKSVTDPSDLPDSDQYLIVPHYESLPVNVVINDGHLDLLRHDGKALPTAILDSFNKADLPVDLHASGRLVGYRGKERQSVRRLEAHLRGENSPVSRLALFLLPTLDLIEPEHTFSPDANVRLIPHRFAGRGNILSQAREIMTKSGVEIWPMDEPHRGYRFRPSAMHELPVQRYALRMIPDAPHAILTLNTRTINVAFFIKHFHQARLDQGARFFADQTACRSLDGCDGEIVDLTPVDSAFRLTCSGYLDGSYLLRPIRVDGRRRFLFFKLMSGSAQS